MHSLAIEGHVGSVQPIRKVGDSFVLNFSVASTDYAGKNKKTTWFSCSLWGPVAEAIAQWLTVGKNVLLMDCVLQSGDDGNPKVFDTKKGPASSYSVRVGKVRLLGSGKEAEAEYVAPVEEDEDDIPF